MQDKNAIEIIRRWDDLDGARGTWKAHWQDLLDHTVPRKTDVDRARSAGEKRTEKQFDGTAAIQRDGTVIRCLAPPWRWGVTDQTEPTMPAWMKDDAKWQAALDAQK